MVTYVLGVGSGDRFRITSSGSQLGIYTCWGLTQTARKVALNHVC
jgi:hypothetical protein